MIKVRRLRWADHAARMEENKNVFKMLIGTTTGRDILEGLGVDGRTILE